MRRIGLLVSASLLCAACLDLAQADDGTAGSGGKDAGLGGAGGWPSGGAGGSDGGGEGGAGASSFVGKACSDDLACTPGLCAPLAALTGIGSGNVCTKSCCTTEDCPGGSVCFPTKGGISVCMLAAATGRPDPGSGPLGSTCSLDTDCRSALCMNGHCADSCCSDADCAGSDKCTLVELPGASRSVFLCAPPPGAGSTFTTCSAAADCSSGMCIGPQASKQCTQRCCASSECAGGGQTCVYATLGISSANPIVRICSQSATGTKPLGADCATGSDCAGGQCLSDTKKCTTTCCTDADCETGTVCRVRQYPSGVGAQFCVPP